MSEPINTSTLTHAFQPFVLAVLLAIALGWVLNEGQAILMPIFVAIISVYGLVAASEALGRWPVTRLLPLAIRRALVLLVFVCAIGVLASVVVVTVEELVARAPDYQINIEAMARQLAGAVGLTRIPDWPAIQAATIDRLDTRGMFTALVTSAGSLTGFVFMVAIYSMFLMSERHSFAKKLSAALPDRGNVAQTQELIHEMNQRIGEYLAVKTLVNILLATISYGVLWLFGVDFALFWALIIGLLNYIPYVGSLLGVAFPVLLSVAQFGSIQTTLWIAVLLTAVQMLVGNALEPRMIGQRVNLSPFVVLVSLAFWSALWGIAGAILAIPLTAVLSIGFGAIPATRPLAIMLANDVTIYEHDN